jgi:cGMP-dependent protein kinase
MSLNKLIDMTKTMEIEQYKEKDIIIEDDSEGDKLYLIYKGTVKVLKENKFLREMDCGTYFGETSLLLNRKHTAQVVADTDVIVYTLSKEMFETFLDWKMINFLKRKILYQDNFNLELSDLYFINKLGEGKYGNVSLVTDGNFTYAIKAVQKSNAERQKILINYFKRERNILLSLDHQFIVKLVRTFKNENYIFYLMEHVNGISLEKYLSSLRKSSSIRNKYETQFYVASILICIDYLNTKKIAHRDIKPSNIMIDERGYLKLIDFGTATFIKDFTTTLTGTPHYMAPELLLGKGYSLSVDFWSVGVAAFKMFYNYYPFGNKARDTMQIYKDILRE